MLGNKIIEDGLARRRSLGGSIDHHIVRAAIEACAIQIESHGCFGKGVCSGGLYPKDHYSLCPIRLADELRVGIAKIPILAICTWCAGNQIETINRGGIR